MKKRSRKGKFSKRSYSGFSNYHSSIEHSYSKPAARYLPDISHVTEDIFVQNCVEDWRDGRRVVELGVLADGLRNCQGCDQRLFLHECIGITQAGLASVLEIPCAFCRTMNLVATGKKHGRTWDVNTKLGTAMLHSGVGERQINSILTSLNIPAVSHSTLRIRMKESGDAIESLAKETADMCLQEEVKLEGGKHIEVCVDAGWQKRGSGKSYDSLSGHCSMVGSQTGKVIGFAVRSKDCRVCRVNANAPSHDCRKNWSGSAKAMEPDMVEEMVVSAQRKGIHVQAITGDDDSSTIARLRANVNKNVIKRSDKNHVKKCLSNALYTLQKQHSSLTTRVITSIVRNFSYMLSQNKGNPGGISDGLSAQSRHPFGDHSRCQKTWCKMIKDRTHKHASLPFGKPLSSTQLQDSLDKLFATYQKHVDKLSYLGSTQANESFNNTIASKAPKSHHFSASANLNYRVSAAVAQKNIGHKYLIEAHRKIGISPGTYTSRLCTLRDIQGKKRKAIAVTVSAKRRRLKVKQERCKKKSVNELHEGPLYQSNLLLDIGENLPESIPEAVCRPSATNLKAIPKNQIYFDLETTGLGRNEHITQMAALRGEQVFSTYVLPKKPIKPKASEVTKIDVIGDQMFYKNTAIDTLGIKEALTQFIIFLSKSEDNILIGHNIQSFDCPVLFNALEKCEMVHSFASHVIGFVDTRHVFKSFKPCNQQSLARHFLLDNYNAHNAIDDVHILQQIIHKAAPSLGEILKSSFPVNFSIEMNEYMKHVNKNLPSVQKLIDSKIVSSSIARRIAGSGLSFDHLLLAYKRNGIMGIDDLFSNSCSNRTVRVTKSQKIINAVGEYLSRLCT